MATALDMQAAYAAARREARKQRTLARPTSESRAATTLAPPLPAPCPGVVRYHPEFLSEAEATALAAGCRALPGWVATPRRRVLSAGGAPHPSGAWAEPLPPCLAGLAARVAAYFGGARSRRRQRVRGGGIDAHRDGPLYEGLAVVVSLGSSARLDFSRRGERVASVVLRPRSLLAFSGDAYEGLEHAIAAVPADAVDGLVRNRDAAACAVGDVVARSRRLSVTFRRFRTVARTLDGVDATLLAAADRAELERRRAWWASSISEKDDDVESPPAAPLRALAVD
ncbi:ferrous iron binding protein [Aureococcus anophagefferens]|nr:ferrous iron binding protein [Aureococcus anophagefferens]